MLSADLGITPPMYTLITRFMGPSWGPPGDDRTQVGPMLAPWTLLSGYTFTYILSFHRFMPSVRALPDQIKLGAYYCHRFYKYQWPDILPMRREYIKMADKIVQILRHLKRQFMPATYGPHNLIDYWSHDMASGTPHHQVMHYLILKKSLRPVSMLHNDNLIITS